MIVCLKLILWGSLKKYINFSLLIDKLVEEKDENILIKVLMLLHRLLDGRDLTESILKTPVISRLSNLFNHKNKIVLINSLIYS